MNNFGVTKPMLRKEIGLTTKTPWEIVDIQILHPRGRMMGIWLKGYATPFKVGGIGHGRSERLLIDFINYWLGRGEILIYGSSTEGLEGITEQLTKLNDDYYSYKLLYNGQVKDGEMYQLSRISIN